MFRKIFSCSFVMRSSWRNLAYNTAYKNENADTIAVKKSSSFDPKYLTVIDDNLANKDHLTPDEWKHIKSNLILLRGVTQENINSVILQHLISSKKFEHGKDFVSQLKQDSQPPNISFLGHVAVLYYYCGAENVTKEEKMEISQSYNQLVNKYKLLDAQTYSRFANGFLVTDDWKESLKILEKIRAMTKVSQVVYNNIISTAFDHCETDVGWRLLDQMIQDGNIPLNKTFISWIKCSKKIGKNKASKILDNMEKMLHFCGENEIPMTSEAAVEYKNVFEDVLGWNGAFLDIGSNGFCKKCKSKLVSVEITSDEFQLLHKTFFNKVIVGENAFIKSHPEEIKRYMKFLKDNPPFDVVLDGLNILYSIPGMKKSQILTGVVQYFLDNEKRVFILGRKHLESTFKKHELKFINQNARMFLVDDLSYDDIFLLYAALQSEHTQFISRDFMRSHKFLLGDKNIQNIFKKWQKKSQLILHRVEPSGRVLFKPTSKYLGTVQKDIGWHIPYIEERLGALPETMDFPKKWLCLQPPLKKKS